ncbi:MAG TPA: hypothetical protein VHX16_04675 [Chloroflexota bacterium]|jgi:hypothetical protein|nr:hypothetical protein [Chloroflexota bacterium]
MELLKLLLPFLVPLVIGIASTVFGQLLLTSRRLRSELATDSDMVDRLPDEAQDELREEIRRRTFQLVAYIRYPTLTRPEILALLAMLLITAASVAAVWDMHRVGQEPNQNPLLVSGFWVALMASCWVFFLHSWVERSANRVGYIQRRLGVEQARETLRVLRVTWWGAMLGGLACVLTPFLSLLFVSDVYELRGGQQGWAIAGVIVLGVLFFVLSVGLSQKLLGGSTSEHLLRNYLEAEEKQRAAPTD